VRHLQKDGKGGFEFVGNGFQVKDKDIQNIDDLKKAIKKEEELSIAPSKINIYIQEDGKWIGEDEEASVNRGTSKSDCYGFTMHEREQSKSIENMNAGVL